MNRKKTGLSGFDNLVSSGKDLFATRFSPRAFLSTARFRGKLGAAIAVITSLIVGFLTIPNNILYFIDDQYETRTRSDDDEYDYVYIHAGIALITLGCLAMVVSIVLSYFAAKSKRKLDDSEVSSYGGTGPTSTKTVLACLIKQ